jgi:catechol 2,3-dioxygenase-like lactoylglutathione lyase family enzyme
MQNSTSRARRRVLGLAAFAVVIGCQRGDLTSRPVGAEPRAAPRAERPHEPRAALRSPIVRELTLNVSELERALAFYRALDFVLLDERYASGPAFAELVALPGAEARVARLRLGSERVELRQFVAPLGRAVPEDQRSNDGAFQHMAIVVHDMDAAYARVASLGVPGVSPAPQTIPASNRAAGGIRAYYFKDPDRHALELIWYPEGKGRARWQAVRSRTFIGIDHSAIAIADTELGLPFYQELGFVVAGESLNVGQEQEALSGVSGARVRITGLAPRLGPALEFLSYLEPGTGRPAPADAAANDLWHWEVSVEVGDLEAALRAAENAGGKRVSHAPVDLVELELGYRRGALVRDRDGHCVRLVER